MKFIGRTDEYFEIVDITDAGVERINEPVDEALSIIWFGDDDNQFTVDAVNYVFNKDEIITLTGFHNVKINKIGQAKFLRFNRPFYCILDHDSEVGCKGILFYGSSNLPIIKPNEKDLDRLRTVWKMATDEMDSRDALQQEMLQMMLKRLLILFTRIYKSQDSYEAIETPQVDIVREFNYLVETHFKEKHAVSDYAALLNKSPKTLSNLFKKVYDKTPLQLIQQRIMLEARRLLRYTDDPISEIGYDVGFNDVQSFSRFFKKNEGVSPSEFRAA